ncbi:OadG family protein [Clostridium sp.]|uniref:OadG family protein n=1 Tax=Clostridium sp. TaxID=1506 RepID=UPI00346451EF
MSFIEKLSFSGIVTLVSMLIVFMVLIVLMYVIKLQNKILAAIVPEEKSNVKEEKIEVKKPEVVETIKESIDLRDDYELVAAIMGALCAETGSNASDLRIKSIKRIEDNNWNRFSL